MLVLQESVVDKAVQEHEKEKSKDKAVVTLNTDAVLTEIERMGTGLVSGITVQV